MYSAADHGFMQRALRLAERGLYGPHPNPRVGCVIVRDDGIVGEGWHERAGEAHAEILALCQAGERARGAEVYVTLEPCCHHGRTPPCSEALAAAGVSRLTLAMADPNPLVRGGGAAALREAGVEVREGLLGEAALELNRGFAKRMQHGRPLVRSKLAISLDGRMALADGQSQWITSAAARSDGHRLRARSSAILSGIGTVLADDPSFTVRLAPGPESWRQPLRVVVDTRLRLPATAKLLGPPGDTLVFAAADPSGSRAALEAAGARVEMLPQSLEGHVDLCRVLERLGELEVNELLVEAGPGLNGALLAAGLIDEMVIYLAPHLLGDTARGMFALPPLQDMAERLDVEIRDMRAVGQDWRIAVRVRGES